MRGEMGEGRGERGEGRGERGEGRGGRGEREECLDAMRVFKLIHQTTK